MSWCCNALSSVLPRFGLVTTTFLVQIIQPKNFDGWHFQSITPYSDTITFTLNVDFSVHSELPSVTINLTGGLSKIFSRVAVMGGFDASHVMQSGTVSRYLA